MILILESRSPPRPNWCHGERCHWRGRQEWRSWKATRGVQSKWQAVFKKFTFNDRYSINSYRRVEKNTVDPGKFHKSVWNIGSFHSVWCRVCWEKKIAKNVHRNKAHFSTWKIQCKISWYKLDTSRFCKTPAKYFQREPFAHPGLPWTSWAMLACPCGPWGNLDRRKKGWVTLFTLGMIIWFASPLGPISLIRLTAHVRGVDHRSWQISSFLPWGKMHKVLKNIFCLIFSP